MRPFPKCRLIAALVLGLTGVAQKQTAFSSDPLPAPAFNGVAVVKRVISGSERHTFGVGPHAVLLSAQYGRTSDLFPGQPGVESRSPTIWKLEFLDTSVVADIRATHLPDLCTETTVALSATTGTFLARICRAALHRQFASLPAPHFSLAGLLHDLQCKCWHGPVGTISFWLSRRDYLTTIQYGRLRDVAPPGRPITGHKWPRQFLEELIWHLAYVNPHVSAIKNVSNHRSLCPETTVDIRTSDGTEEGWDCIAELRSDVASR